MVGHKDFQFFFHKPGEVLLFDNIFEAVNVNSLTEVSTIHGTNITFPFIAPSNSIQLFSTQLGTLFRNNFLQIKIRHHILTFLSGTNYFPLYPNAKFVINL